MNKKVLRTFITLIWGVLVAFSVVKIFFGDWFAVKVSNEKIRAVGEFIDNHTEVKFLAFFFTRYFTYFFYLCACCRKWNLPIRHHLALAPISLSLVAVNLYFPQYLLVLDILVMVLLPALMLAEYKQFVCIFTLHYVGQLLVLFIRSKPLLMVGQDFATQLITSFDAYLWIVLYYLYANLYREETIWEVFVRRFSVMARRKKSLPKSKN